jgi:hypothetical protein
MSFSKELTPDQIAENLRREIDEAQAKINKYWPSIKPGPLWIRIVWVREHLEELEEERWIQDQGKELE